MSNTIKKIVAVAMALALILSMTVVASATGTTTATGAGLTMRFGDADTNQYPLTHPEANMRFNATTGGFNVTYENGISNYYPDTLAFYIESGANKISSISSSGMTVQPTQRISDTEFQPTTNVQQGFYILYIETTTSGTKSCTFTTTDGTVTLYFDVPTFTPSSGSLIHAYLPAPGQFTNEGITVAGWGEAYESSTNHPLKNNTATGVSLGYYGGYIVFDMGAITRNADGSYASGGVENKSTTPYGTDFIIQGNAFWNNSEPGCIQVSQDYTHWFDIAGNLYYSSNSVAASITYENPDPTEDYGITTAQNNQGTRTAVSYTGTNVTGSSVSVNTFHNHAWFPLNANYFVGRYGNGELSHVDDLPFASRTVDANDITTYLTLTGQRVNTKATASLQYGYADVHQSLTIGGTVSYNPYATIASSSDWSSVSANSSGGDPIDISWAVNSDGSPAKLDAVRYIRVYTGTTIDNPPFGEVSTEVCGIGVCTGTASGSSGTPTVSVKGTNRNTVNGDIRDVDGLGSSEVNVVVSGTGNIYINGAKRTNNTLGVTPSSTGTVVQVIVQDGTAAPYITWLRLYSISLD